MSSDPFLRTSWLGDPGSKLYRKEWIMKLAAAVFLIVAIAAAFAGPGQAKPVEEYIGEAAGQQQTGDLAGAVTTMEGAIQEHPGSLEAHCYLGLYLGMLAGRTEDMTAALDLVNRSFEELDRAVGMDSQDLLARYHRGLMGVSVPEFFGRLDQGIDDLELFIERYDTSSPPPGVQPVKAYDLLARGYRTRGDLERARWAYEQIIDLAPGSELAAAAETDIDDLSRQEKTAVAQPAEKPSSAATQDLEKQAADNPDDLSLLIRLGHAHRREGAHERARETFQAALALDEISAAAHKGLILTIIEQVSRGYDRRIYDNTNLRTNLAFELVKTLDQAVAALPGDLELRLWRGQADVEMPFFVQKLDQGIADLEMIIASEGSDSLKAEALYWLGRGYQKKAHTAWIQVVKEHDESPAADMVFRQMRPGIKHADLSDAQRPTVTIDFVLGFQDELAPQTAVWIETADGQFIKTIYVSGFAGYVRERQVTLPVWGAVSEYVDADAVTGASIDVGHHIYLWDLEDRGGKTVPYGDYVIKVEVSHWPSNLYQIAEAAIEIGKNKNRTVTREGNFIPHLEVTYQPR
jgi:tetratricopeptide (TPR) repeat protein